MVAFTATLSLALGFFIIMGNRAVELESKLIKQKLPTVDINDNGGSCNLNKLPILEKLHVLEKLHIPDKFPILDKLHISNIPDKLPILDIVDKLHIVDKLPILDKINLLNHLLNPSSKEVPIGMNHTDIPGRQKIMVGKRRKMGGFGKLGGESGADSEEEFGRKKPKQEGGEESGGHFHPQDQTQDQKQEEKKQKKREENLLVFLKWRKKMLRRLG